MKKRFLSLLCVLALCLGLLPVTALAAAPSGQELYVGDMQISSTGYWTTGEDGNITQYTGGGTPTDNYIHYNADDNILTLHNATIKKGLAYDQSTPAGSTIHGSAIGVLNQSGDAELTVQLEGSNMIDEVSAGIYVHSSGGGAALSIAGNGTLFIDSTFCPIQVISFNGNAALSIENAKVTATSSYNNGVTVQSGNSENSSASLTVNGGGLIATVQSNNVSGIRFRVTGETGGSSPTVTVSNNAIVRANGSAGGIMSDSSTGVQYGTGGSTTGGIVFDGNTGTVYGEVILQEDLEIGEGETLNIPEGSSLDCNNNLTNNGTILLESGGTLSGGTLSGGTTLTTPTITTHPQAQEVTEGQGATFTVEASAGSETPTYQWQQKTAASGSDWTDISQETSTSYTISSTTTSMSGNQYRCVVKSASGVSVTSAAATLTVEAYIPPTTYTISADVTPMGAGTVTVNGNDTSATVTAGSEVTLTATANEGWRFVGWMENGQQVSSEATYTFTANSARSLTA